LSPVTGYNVAISCICIMSCRYSTSGCVVCGVGLRPLACWGSGFESRRGLRISVSSDCCVWSGRVLCVRLITLPKESYRVWCVWVWSWSFDNEGVMANKGLLRHGMLHTRKYMKLRQVSDSRDTNKPKQKPLVRKHIPFHSSFCLIVTTPWMKLL